MKTNQLMKRPMGQFEVIQRTSDGYFDANALLWQWNHTMGNKRRRMDDFLNSSNTKDFTEELCKEANGEKTPMADFQAIKEIKGRNTRNGRTRDQIWVHPYLFIKFAMWINPKFELQVIKFVYDELIKNRHLAGDNYNVLTSAIATLPNADYREIANAINWIVFNRIGKNLRQSATQDELKELSDVEHSVAFAINMGFVKDNQQLIMLLRKMYNDKNRKF